MTRDEYKKMRMDEVQKQLSKAEEKMNGTSSGKEKDQAEYQYQSLKQQQADWERGGFWTHNEETAYQKNYAAYHRYQ